MNALPRPPGPAVATASLAGRSVVIVGAGVAGASLAWAAAHAGAAVTVLEAERVGVAGASAVPAALINPHRGRSGSARPADLEGARTLWRWAEALRARGLEGGAMRDGVVRVASNARQRRAWSALEGVRHVGEGTLGPFRLPHGGFVVDDGGWLDPQAWLHALLHAAEGEGARLLEGTRAERIEGGADAVRVVTDAGAFPADLVALCLGASEPGALPGVRVRRVAGEVVLTPHETLPHALAGGVYAAPMARSADRPALLAIGGNHREPADAPARPDDAQRLLASVRWSLPNVGDAVDTLWSGVRARADDAEPIVREVAPGVWSVGAFAGRGFLRAASTAESVVSRWARSG